MKALKGCASTWEVTGSLLKGACVGLNTEQSWLWGNWYSGCRVGRCEMPIGRHFEGWGWHSTSLPPHVASQTRQRQADNGRQGQSGAPVAKPKPPWPLPPLLLSPPWPPLQLLKRVQLSAAWRRPPFNRKGRNQSMWAWAAIDGWARSVHGWTVGAAVFDDLNIHDFYGRSLMRWAATS